MRVRVCVCVIQRCLIYWTRYNVKAGISAGYQCPLQVIEENMTYVMHDVLSLLANIFLTVVRIISTHTEFYKAC